MTSSRNSQLEKTGFTSYIFCYEIQSKVAIFPFPKSYMLILSAVSLKNKNITTIYVQKVAILNQHNT